MKHIHSAAIFILCLLGCKNHDNAYIIGISEHRKNIDAIFRHPKNSPLSDNDFQKFTGLSYYDIDINYRVEARIEKFDSSSIVQIDHTLNRKYPFIRWGEAFFRLFHDSCHLTIYLSIDKDSLSHKMFFIPFKDATNGIETYPGGRYLDLDINGNSAIIDFNLSYNPNCAYSDQWSCPLVPDENKLAVAVKAGIKNYIRVH